MTTVIFDFDSTLISLESLDEILRPEYARRPDLEKKINAITAQGMAGEIPFHESLARRLALARPKRADVRAFGRLAIQLITPGVKDLIASLHRREVQVRIASGGLREAILPCAEYLGVPPEWVHAVCPVWGADGFLADLDPDDLMARSKTEGVRLWIDQCPRPAVAVGDGMTDYALFRDGLVDHFIAFTANVRRPNLIKTGMPEAHTVAELAELLEDRL